MERPSFVTLAESGVLAERAEFARALLSSCRLCPRECRVDRTSGEFGYCRAGPRARVFRHMAHPGEEPPISGTRGSGVIFFSHCTMSCCYCQNERFSQRNEGTERSPGEVADMMRDLADLGCHNLNLVSATQHLATVLEALLLAWKAGVTLPVVWNTSSYESDLALRLLDGVVDVYLADIRYSSSEASLAYSDAADYVERARIALLEMRRQVGDLELDGDGIARRGLIVRLLVLPNGISGTERALRFVAERLGTGTFVSLMAQYYPVGRARELPELARRITPGEWEKAVEALRRSGLPRGWVQEYPRDVPPIAGSQIAPDGGRRDDVPGDAGERGS